MFSDNHANETVPEQEFVSGFRIAQIYVGVAITLPAFLLAAEVFSALGLRDGSTALALTAVLMFVISGAAMLVGARTRLTTYAIVRSVFGRHVARVINLLMALVLLGWFAVTISLFADALSGASLVTLDTAPPTWVLKALGGVAMILLTVFGFRAIDNLSRFVVPLLALVLALAFARVLNEYGLQAEAWTNIPAPNAGIATVGAAVSIMLGAFMAGITISPDIARFARTPAQSVLASFLSFGFVSQLVMLAAGVPALITGEKDFVRNLIAIGFGWPALFVVVFATITTNINNLYSVSLSFGQLLPKVKDHHLTAAFGLIGTAIALAGIENFFIPFLLFLGVAIPPIAGVYISAFLLSQTTPSSADAPRICWRAVAAWLVGSMMAFATSNAVFELTGIPALDAILTSGVVYLAASRLLPKRSSLAA